MAGGRGGVGVGLAVGVVLGLAMAVTFLVHAFVQDLGFFPAMLGAGRTEGDQDGGGEEGEGGFLHERDNGVRHPIGGVSPLARAGERETGAY